MCAIFEDKNYVSKYSIVMQKILVILSIYSDRFLGYSKPALLTDVWDIFCSVYDDNLYIEKVLRVTDDYE
jgi:hypothetical protein